MARVLILIQAIVNNFNTPFLLQHKGTIGFENLLFIIIEKVVVIRILDFPLQLKRYLYPINFCCPTFKISLKFQGL